MIRISFEVEHKSGICAGLVTSHSLRIDAATLPEWLALEGVEFREYGTKACAVRRNIRVEG